MTPESDLKAAHSFDVDVIDEHEIVEESRRKAIEVMKVPPTL